MADTVKYLLSLLVFSGLLPYSTHAQLTYATLRVDYDSAWKYKNLKIIPIRQKGGGGKRGLPAGNPGIVSLSQALNQGLVTVSERGTTAIENVHWLRINNHSDKSIYV